MTNRPAALSLLCLVILFATSYSARAIPQDSIATQQEAAVLAARSGHLDEALAELDRLRLEQPENRSLLIDQTIVLSWANNDRRVIENSTALDPLTDPPQVLAAVAKSFRNLQQFALSIQWYRDLLKREPGNVDNTLGLAMVLADDGRIVEAKAELDALAKAERDSLAGLQVRAYVLQREGCDVECLHLYDAMLALDPDNMQTLHMKAMLLRDMRLPEHALELAKSYPTLLSAEEIENLQADVIALSIRSAARTYSPEGTEWRNSEQALKALDDYLENVPAGTTLQRRLRGDRMVALVDVGLMKEAVTEYEWLAAQGNRLSRIELLSAGQAHLATGQAETARQLLEQCLQESPKHYDCRVQHVYALLAVRELEQAIVEADAIFAEQPVIDPIKLKPNPRYLDSQLLAVLARSYADRLDEAQQELEAITAAVPHNPSARLELGGNYLWRGWPDRALAEFQQVLTVYPKHVSARTGWIQTQMQRQEFREAGNHIGQLQSEFPYNRSVQRLTRSWRQHQKSTLVVDASLGNSTGSTFGSEQYTAQSWWYTPPVRDWYRFYAHSFDGFAELPEGNSHRARIAAGVEYRRSDWSARSEISNERWGGDAGFHGELGWRMSDLWSLAASAEINSYNTPLRAYENDVKSNQFSLRADFGPNELLGLGSTISFADFDDGNRRSSISVYGRKRTVNLPRFKLDATGSIGASRSTLDNARYFNPDADQSVMLGADMRWTRLLNSERQFYFRVHPQIGTYFQQSYGDENVWVLGGEFGFRVVDRWNFKLGVQRARHAYDSDVEYSDFLFFGFEARL